MDGQLLQNPPQHILICLTQNAKKTLGLPRTCYGRPAEEELVKKLLSRERIAASYSVPCTAALLACAFFTWRVDEAVADTLVTCGLPVALAGHVRGRVLGELEESNRVGLFLPQPPVAVALGAGSGALVGVGAGLLRTSDLIGLYLRIKEYGELGVRAPFFYRGVLEGLSREEVAGAVARALLGKEKVSEAGVGAVEKILEESGSYREAVMRLGLLRRVYSVIREKAGPEVAEEFLVKVGERGSVRGALEEMEFDTREVRRVVEGLKNAGLEKIDQRGQGGLDVSAYSSDEAMEEAVKDVENEGERLIKEADEVLEREVSGSRSAKLKEGLVKGAICGTIGALVGSASYVAFTPAGLSSTGIPSVTIDVGVKGGNVEYIGVNGTLIGGETAGESTPGNRNTTTGGTGNGITNNEIYRGIEEEMGGGLVG